MSRRSPLTVHWRTGGRRAPRDVLRLRADADRHVVTMANAFDSGFATSWPAGSRLLLDRFDRFWAGGRGPTPERLAGAFRAARDSFCTMATSLVPRDPDFPEASPAATLLVAVVERDRVHVRWLGGDQALLARRGMVVARMRPHSLRERSRGLVPDPSTLPNVLSRTICADQPEHLSDATTFGVAPGDWLVLLSRTAFHGPCVSPERAAELTASDADRSMAATIAAEASTDAPYVAVAALLLS